MSADETNATYQGLEDLETSALTAVQQEAEEGEKVAPARILEYAMGRHIALPTHTTLEIVENPEIFPVPETAPHGLGLFNWQDNWIAVIDLARLLGQPELSAVSADAAPRYVLVVAFQRRPGLALEYGGIVLPEAFSASRQENRSPI